MDIVTAETIGKKTKALKHCDKLLKQIEKNGSAKVILNCTGVEFIVNLNDAIYCRLQSKKYQLLDEIRSYELTSRSQRAVNESATPRRTAPAPVGASNETPTEEVSEITGLPSIRGKQLTPEEMLERKRVQRRIYNQRWLAKKNS